MISFKRIASAPAALPVVSDDVVEFHAARIMLLIYFCGKGRLKGLTKLAKLDFFVRYPSFFNRVMAYLGENETSTNDEIESKMVRFHYGPWDRRYYHVLAYLESRRLISILKEKKTYIFTLTELGLQISNKLAADSCFDNTCRQMKLVKKHLGSKSGSSLKTLVYQVFDDEVAKRKLGEVIDYE